MKDTDKLDLIQLAKNLTGSSSMEELIKSANLLNEYLNGRKPDSIINGPRTFVEFLNILPIVHPTYGALIFVPYSYQIDVAKHLDSEKNLAINHARQMGISLLVTAYALWKAISEPDQQIVLLGHKLTYALEMMERIRYSYERLPFHKPKTVEYNKGTISFENGSKIITRAMTPDSLRGLSINLLILSDVAFCPHGRAEDMWAAAQPMLTTGGRIIAHSTPNDDIGLFHTICRAAPGNGFTRLDIPYRLHPERDDTWAIQQRLLVGFQRFQSDYECKFIANHHRLAREAMATLKNGGLPKL